MNQLFGGGSMTRRAVLVAVSVLAALTVIALPFFLWTQPEQPSDTDAEAVRIIGINDAQFLLEFRGERLTTETSRTLKEWQFQALFGADYEKVPVPSVNEVRDTGDPTHPYSVRIGDEWVLARRSGLGK
jgi:hypothetical protein